MEPKSEVNNPSSIQADIVRRLTAAVREADEQFEHDGGGVVSTLGTR